MSNIATIAFGAAAPARKTSSNHRTLLLRTAALLAILGSTALAGPAAAQDAVAPPAETPALPEAASPDQRGQEIVVTASRINRAGFTAPTPTTVIGQHELQQRATTNIADILNEMPAFRPTQTPTQRTFFAGAGQNTADLRGLGSQRTLVLLDGRRHVPSSALGVIDLNLIPTIMIDRTEIVTGGASAAWGSDAVAGVLNLITNTTLDGFKSDVSYGISHYGDGREFRGGLAFGGDIDSGRGHFVIGGEYVEQGGILDAYTARPWARDEWGLITVPTSVVRPAGQPSRFYAHPVRALNEPPGGVILGVNADTNLANGANVLRGIRFGPGGSVLPYDYGQVYGTSSLGGGARNPGATGDLSVPLKRYSAIANIDYEITDNIEAFLQGGVARSAANYPTIARRNQASNAASPVDFTLIRRDNAFLPAEVAQIMDANNITQFYLGRGGVDLGRPTARPTNETHRIALGLRGKLSESWRWDAYYEYGQNHYSQIYENMSIESNYQKAYDAVRNSAGQIVCRVNQTTVTDAACVPLNVMGTGVASQAAIDYTLGTQIFETDYTQQVWAANLDGEPFSTWAGPVSIAIGGEYRRERVKAIADEISIRQDWDYNNNQPYQGSFDVKEFYGETVIPLLKDSPVGKSLELNAAVRHADYSYSGGVTTWKAGLSYQPIDDIRFRITKSRDIRAPNLLELFGVSKATVTGTNPYTLVSIGFVQGTTGGNPNLKPEKADTFTAGVVLQPEWLRRFRASVDYYNIKVKDAIATYTTQNILDNCKTELTAGSTPFFCNYVSYTGSPGPSFAVTGVTSVPFNLTSQTTEGIDLEAIYSFPLLSGNINLRGLATYTMDRTNIDLTGKTQHAGYLTGVPKWLGNVSATYNSNRFSTTLQARYIGAVKINPTLIGPGEAGYSPTLSNSVSDNRNSAFVYLNWSIQYDIMAGDHRTVQLYAVVNNLLDKDPPYTGASYLYDVVGRYFKVGARLNF